MKTAITEIAMVGEGVKTYLKDVLAAQGIRVNSVTFVAGPGTVTMHGSERVDVTEGIMSFDDTQYQVGFNKEADGNLTVVYDSWVLGGGLQARIDGTGTKGSAANLKVCTSLAKTKRAAALARRKMSLSFHEGRARAFVHA